MKFTFVPQSGASVRVVNQLLTEMDGLESRQQVFIMAATNRPGMNYTTPTEAFYPQHRVQDLNIILLIKTTFVYISNDADKLELLVNTTQCFQQPG